jgi:uncharacterized coiled-coil protein SlyX
MLIAKMERMSEEMDVIRQLSGRVSIAEKEISLLNKVSVDNTTTLRKHKEGLDQLSESFSELDVRIISLEIKQFTSNWSGRNRIG